MRDDSVHGVDDGLYRGRARSVSAIAGSVTRQQWLICSSVDRRATPHHLGGEDAPHSDCSSFAGDVTVMVSVFLSKPLSQPVVH